jgi:hypothetical protein
MKIVALILLPSVALLAVMLARQLDSDWGSIIVAAILVGSIFVMLALVA